MAHAHAQSLFLAVKPVTPLLASERDTLRSVQLRIVYIRLITRVSVEYDEIFHE